MGQGTELVTPIKGRLLTAADYQRLAEVPPEIEWFGNLSSTQTRRAYENALKDFRSFTGIAQPEEFRTVTRAHVIAWRENLVRRGLGPTTIRHRLSALSSLFEYLCDRNAVTYNPVKGVKRPPVDTYEGKTPAIGDHLSTPPGARAARGAERRCAQGQARSRDHFDAALSRAAPARALPADRERLQPRAPRRRPSSRFGQGRQDTLRAFAPGGKRSHQRLPRRGRPRRRGQRRPLSSFAYATRPRLSSIDYTGRRLQDRSRYSALLGFEIGAHALRATAATNALDHQADIAKVQEWLGHANIATTRI